VPRPFFDPTAAAAAGRFSLSEPVGSRFYRWTRPCSCLTSCKCCCAPARSPQFNAPTGHLSHFWPVFGAPKPPRIQDKRTRHPLPRPAGEVSIWNPYGSDRRDPNTLAPNKIKA